ncbi:MAG: hypothetical protein GY711_19625 [bacterium]|nr:hypothetical protein [bacterium]
MRDGDRRCLITNASLEAGALRLAPLVASRVHIVATSDSLDRVPVHIGNIGLFINPQVTLPKCRLAAAAAADDGGDAGAWKPQHWAAPFWLARRSAERSEANMVFSKIAYIYGEEIRSVPDVTLPLAGEEASVSSVEVPLLTNARPLEAGEELVVFRAASEAKAKVAPTTRKLTWRGRIKATPT